MPKHSVAIIALGLAVLAGQSFGFVFHDPVHTAQTVAYKMQQYQQMIEQIHKSTEMVAKAQEQIQKFQQYRQVFDGYYGTFLQVYRAIDHGNWESLATTINQLYLEEVARRQDEINEQQAEQIRREAAERGLTQAGTQLSRAEIDAMIEALTETEYYKKNPAVTEMVDYYAQKLRSGYEYNNSYLNKINATSQVIEARRETIARLEQQNRQLSTGSDQQSLVAQQALTNQLLLELIKMQNEMDLLLSMQQAREVNEQLNFMETKQLETEMQGKRRGVMDELLAPLSTESKVKRNK